MFILDWIRNVAAAALSSEETAFATLLDYSVKKTGPMYWKQQPLSLEKS